MCLFASLKSNEGDAPGILRFAEAEALVESGRGGGVVCQENQLAHMRISADQLRHQLCSDTAALMSAVDKDVLHIQDGLAIADSSGKSDKGISLPCGDNGKGGSDTAEETLRVSGVCGPACVGIQPRQLRARGEIIGDTYINHSFSRV